jgi:hypothetical protein
MNLPPETFNRCLTMAMLRLSQLLFGALSTSH